MSLEKNKKSKIGWFPVLGLNCSTCDGRKPYFFLFADIDSKDKDQLRRVLKYFAKNDLTFYWWETSKGFHVVSPVLLNIEEWHNLKRPLSKILTNYYEFLNIRISKKPSDPQTILQLWIGNKDKSESKTLHRYIQKKFSSDLAYDKDLCIETNLSLVKYEEFYLDECF